MSHHTWAVVLIAAVLAWFLIALSVYYPKR